MGASVSEVTKHPASELVQNTSNKRKLFFAKQSSYAPSGIPYHKGEKVSTMTKTFDLESTGIMRYSRLANKPKQKYDLFDKLSLSLIGACEVAKNPTSF